MTQVEQVRSVLIPLSNSRLLLPNAVVAEVMDYQTPSPRGGVSSWYLGDLAWRGLTIPLVSFEAMLGGAVALPGRRGRTLVMNTLNGAKDLTHIALVSQAIPSLVRVSLDNIEESKLTGDLGGLISQPVNVNGSLALIPDLDELERRVRAAVGK